MSDVRLTFFDMSDDLTTYEIVTVNRPSFDNAQSHVTAFRPISESARSWSDDNALCRLMHENGQANLEITQSS